MLDQDVARNATPKRRNHCETKNANEIKFVSRMALSFERAAEGSCGYAGEVQ
jgi:hypothetical protein